MKSIACTCIIILWSGLLHSCWAQKKLNQDEKHLTTSILVVGGSTGGIAAGLQSARMGIATLIVEPTPWLGGMISAAGVTATDGNHLLPSGIWEDFRQALYQHYQTRNLNTGWVSNTLFEPYVADSICKAWAEKEKHLHVLYGWYFDSAYTHGGKLQSVRFVNRQHEFLYVDAAMVIDGTDLGDVFAGAGAGFDVGMEDPAYSGEPEAPGKYNIIQDLTWAATLKDYGPHAGASILIRKDQFDSSVLKEFDCSTSNAPCPEGKPYPFDTKKVLEYGKLPHQKFMLNWPAHGNDYFINGIGIKPIDRESFYTPAKQQTLAFLYYIQQQLGFSSIGLDTSAFPTADHLALMPYHREGRRLKGIVRLTLPYLHHEFEQEMALYRTGIAVGDYPVDHHHGKNPGAPRIGFPSIHSFNIPLAALIPEKLDGLVVCEKGISVSNLVNGCTRLQPCVLLTGQAAGVLAALSVQQQREARDISVRAVQQALLEAHAFLMPYVDVSKDDPAFESIQRVGATGILRGRGITEAWANKTYFAPDSLCNGNGLIRHIKDLIGNDADLPAFGESISMKDLVKLYPVFRKFHKTIPALTTNRNYNNKPLTRKEVAVWLDQYCKPFDLPINHQGLAQGLHL